MNSSVPMAATDLLALLLGSGNQKMPAGPVASGFGELLNIAPAKAVPAAGGEQPPLTSEPETNADRMLEGMIPIMIPDEVLSLLGQPALSTSGPDSMSEIPPSPGGMVMAGAELLAPEDGSGEPIYLRIQTHGEEESFMPDTGGERQEMILPMRLRTVEHRDGRIIADGEMLTAAGKDVPIRLQLQVAENAMPELQADLSASGNGKQAPAGQALSGGQSMARMLSDLHVEMIVVEPAVAETTPTARMPFADIMGRSDRSIKAGDVVKSSVAVDGLAASAKPMTTQAAAPILPTMPESPETSTYSDGSTDIQAAEQETPDMVDQVVGREDTSLAIGKAGGSSPMVSTITALSESGIDDAKQQSTDVAQVRFYDLDHKLEQLKQSPGQRIKIQLVPSNLGKMELSIVSHRGLVTVNLAVESTQAKQAVERNLPQLEQRLASSGIKVDGVQLQVNHPARGTTFAQTQQHYQQGGFDGRGGRGSYQSPYYPTRNYRMATPDAGFRQELINCLA